MKEHVGQVSPGLVPPARVVDEGTVRGDTICGSHSILRAF